MKGELARRTRLELATSGVTGRCSNQLNYRREARFYKPSDQGAEASLAERLRRLWSGRKKDL